MTVSTHSRLTFVAIGLMMMSWSGRALASGEPTRGVCGITSVQQTDTGGAAQFGGRWIAVLSESSSELSLGPTLVMEVTNSDIRMNLKMPGGRVDWRCSLNERSCSNSVGGPDRSETVSRVKVTKDGLRISTVEQGASQRNVIREFRLDERGFLLVDTKENNGPSVRTVYQRLGGGQ